MCFIFTVLYGDFCIIFNENQSPVLSKFNRTDFRAQTSSAYSFLHCGFGRGYKKPWFAKRPIIVKRGGDGNQTLRAAEPSTLGGSPKFRFRGEGREASIQKRKDAIFVNTLFLEKKHRPVKRQMRKRRHRRRSVSDIFRGFIGVANGRLAVITHEVEAERRIDCLKLVWEHERHPEPIPQALVGVEILWNGRALRFGKRRRKKRLPRRQHHSYLEYTRTPPPRARGMRRGSPYAERRRTSSFAQRGS